MASKKKQKRDVYGWGEYDRPKNKPVPETVPTSPGKKDTRKWCKGKVGREHKPEIVRNHYYTGPLFKDCGPRHGYDWLTGEKWRCYHSERCSACGKYLRHWLKQAECPTWLASQEVKA